MKKTLIACALIFAGAASSASAGLVGDSLTLTHYYPDAFSPYESHNVVGAVGTSDLVNFAVGYTVDVEGSSINVDMAPSDANFPTGWMWISPGFEGLVITGIDDVVTGVSVSTNLTVWDNSRLSFTGDSISVRWQGLLASPQQGEGTYFRMDIQQRQNVPEAASTFALFGGVFVAFVGLRRKLGKA